MILTSRRRRRLPIRRYGIFDDIGDAVGGAADAVGDAVGGVVDTVGQAAGQAASVAADVTGDVYQQAPSASVPRRSRRRRLPVPTQPLLSPISPSTSGISGALAGLPSALAGLLEPLNEVDDVLGDAYKDATSEDPRERYDRLVAGRPFSKGKVRLTDGGRAAVPGSFGLQPVPRSAETEIASGLIDTLGLDRPGLDGGRVNRVGKLPVYGNLGVDDFAQVAGRGNLTRFAGGVTTPRLARQGRSLRAPYPGLDEHQARVLNIVLGEGLEAGATPRDLLAATETGLVESSLRNLGYGDADSQGWRQERTSIYGTGPTGPRNVEASAERFFDELETDAGASTAATPGLAAQAAQGSAFPERYDEREGEALPLVNEYLKRARVAKRLGIPLPGAGPVSGTPGAAQPVSLEKRPGPYAGSRRIVSSLLGQPVWGDKEPGHSAGGMHDPANPVAYAQDIGSAYTEGNPSEGEPPYSQDTVSGVVRRLRGRGADIPANFALGENWEGGVGGYDIEFLTAPHGTGPHIHLGAEYSGEAPPPGTYSGSPGSTSGQAASLVAAGAPAPLVGQAVAASNQRPPVALTSIAPPISTEVALPEDFQDLTSSGAPEPEGDDDYLLNLLSQIYQPQPGALVPQRRRRRT